MENINLKFTQIHFVYSAECWVGMLAICIIADESFVLNARAIFLLKNHYKPKIAGADSD